MGGIIIGFISVFLMQKDKYSGYDAHEAQLVMSLKFHFSEILTNAPLHIALNAMAKTWESCQEDFDDDKTLVFDQQIIDREIYR